MEILTDTIDNGTIDKVHLAPIGDFVGSKPDGSPVDEHLTYESLEKLANSLNAEQKEVLFDIDHQSTKPGNQKNTAAVGWFKNFIVDPIKGLFAMLKLTKMGKELIENREYRFVSPTFSLNEAGQPVELHSVAATNLPAFAGYIQPILNTESKTLDKKDILNMTKEELVGLIKETIVSLNSEPAKVEEPIEEPIMDACAKADEPKAEQPKVEQPKVEQPKVEEVKNEEPKVEQPKVEQPKVEQPKVEEKKAEEPVMDACAKNEEPKVEEPKVEEKKEEVIPLETLNSAPVPQVSEEPAWKKLSGKEFCHWIEAGKFRI